MSVSCDEAQLIAVPVMQAKHTAASPRRTWSATACCLVADTSAVPVASATLSPATAIRLGHQLVAAGMRRL